jgi:hypothetical protein
MQMPEILPCAEMGEIVSEMPMFSACLKNQFEQIEQTGQIEQVLPEARQQESINYSDVCSGVGQCRHEGVSSAEDLPILLVTMWGDSEACRNIMYNSPKAADDCEVTVNGEDITEIVEAVTTESVEISQAAVQFTQFAEVAESEEVAELQKIPILAENPESVPIERETVSVSDTGTAESSVPNYSGYYEQPKGEHMPIVPQVTDETNTPTKGGEQIKFAPIEQIVQVTTQSAESGGVPMAAESEQKRKTVELKPTVFAAQTEIG